ncbi:MULTISPECIES: DUF3540 domain-containing protein [unclassified Caballeronia]|uniref:DUF3540 domain-containing protein n=1 Tax=unclassified Caballeronia TaxID=2646786 RepID=UPI002027D6BB|nr:MULTISPECIES: DUF3540 domain-containing protein [unclassified Caballeronia]
MDHASLSSNTVQANAGLCTAIVTGRADKWLFLDGFIERALRAESCLLEPETGDLVLVCPALPALAALPDAAGKAASMCVPYVLAVLTRAPSAMATATLTLPGGARLNTADGELRVHAARIALDGSECVSARTRALSFESVTTELVTQQATTRIGVLDAGIGRMTMAAKSLVSTIGRLLQRSQESTRWVEGTDELRTGSARWRVEGHAHFHTRHTTMQSDEMTRIDGSKIELG